MSTKSFIMTIKTEASDILSAIKKIEQHIKGEVQGLPVHVDIKEEGQEPVPAAPATPPTIPQPAPAPQVGRAPVQRTTVNSWL